MQLSTLLSSLAISFAFMLQAAISPALADEPKAGGTLTIGNFQAPRHLNGGVQSGMATAIPSTQLFASLLRYDDEWNALPYLATEWEWSDDGKTFTAKLRDNAVFHDGEPITSEDVAFSIMAVKEHHPFKTMLDAVVEVETPDPHTAVFKLSRPHPALLIALSPALTPIMPKHIYDDGQDLKNHPRNTSDVVGSGPFKFKRFTPGKEVVMERFDDFFLEDKPYLDRLVIQTNQDVTTLLMSLQRGDLQMVPFASEPAVLKLAEADKSLQFINRGYEGIGSLTWMAINTAKEPLDDVRVRKAIAYSLDKEFMIKALTGGYAERADGPIIASSPFATPDVVMYEQNLDKANELLDEAGLEPDKNGIRFKIVIDQLPGAQFGKTSAEYARSQLKKIGIDAELRTAADFPTWTQYIANHDFDMTTDNVWNWGDPVIGVHRTFLSSNIRNVVWTNTQSYRNDRVDELLDAAAVELDEDKRKELYAEFQKIVTDEVPIIHNTQTPYHTLAADNVGNVPQTIWGPLSPMDDVYLK
ncbi:MAG TPA: ABC transporter substrate-binding protein [Burkholderiaceae bacterium]|nr:ABC transporter substrate-binding protein [Burkholderiaceae bacterium]